MVDAELGAAWIAVRALTSDLGKDLAGARGKVQKELDDIAGGAEQRIGGAAGQMGAALVKGFQAFFALEIVNKVGEIVGSVVEAAGEIDALAGKIGDTAENVQRLQAVAENFDVSIEALTGGVQELQRALGEGRLDEPLRKLNIEVEEFRKLSPTQQVLEVADALGQIEDPALRAALAKETLGKSAKGLSAALKDGVKDQQAWITMSDDTVAALDAGATAWAMAKSSAMAFGAEVLVNITQLKTFLELYNLFSEAEPPKVAAPAGLEGAAYTPALDPNDADAMRAAEEALEEGFKRVTKAQEEASKKAAELKRIHDTLFGEDLIARAGQYLTALGGVDNAGKLTEAQQEALNRVVGEGLEAYRALGREAPPELQKVYDATATLKGASFFNLADNLGGFREAAKSAGEELAAVGGSLSDLPSDAEWLNRAFAPFPPAVKDAKEAIREALGETRSWGKAVEGFAARLPGVILDAFKGGGDIGRSIGGLLGQELGQSAASKAGEFLTKHLGKSLGGALGSIIPGLGTALGGMLGALTDKVFGKLFKTEGKQVNNLRDEFTAAHGGIDALAEKVRQAGGDMRAFFAADTVEEWKAAVAGIEGIFGEQASQIALAKQAADEFGISFEEMGQAFKQNEMNERAGGFLEKITALVNTGVSLDTVIQKAGDDIGAFVHQSIRAGTAVPKELEKIIAKMIESGTLIDENGEKFTDLSQIPFASGPTEQLAKIADKLDRLLSKLFGVDDAAGAAADGITDHFAGVEIPPIEVPFEYVAVNEPPGGADAPVPDVPAMALGGVVRRATLALVGEAGPEAVIPLRQYEELLAGRSRLQELLSRERTPQRPAFSLPDILAGRGRQEPAPPQAAEAPVEALQASEHLLALLEAIRQKHAALGEEWTVWAKAQAEAQEAAAAGLQEGLERAGDFGEAIGSELAIEAKKGANAIEEALEAIKPNPIKLEIDDSGWGLFDGGGRLGRLEIPAMAEGGLVTGPTLALIGEAGPEVVTPLSRAGGIGGPLGADAEELREFSDRIVRGVGDRVAGAIATMELTIATRLRDAARGAL
jgi:hypothetical protein